jgi:hydroxylaminobenzene mutase
MAYGAMYREGPVPPYPAGGPLPYPALPPHPGARAAPYPPYPPPPYPGFVPGFAPPRRAARPRPSGAAVWSLVLGIVGVVTAPLLGGVVPGVLAVALAASARREILAAEGWLTGTRLLVTGRALGWVAIWVAVTMIVALAALWLINVGDAAVDPTYPDTVD